MSTQDLEVRIKALKVKRDTLISTRAEKAARLSRAKEDMSTLKEEALALGGYELKDLSTVLATKRQELEDMVTAAEAAMADAEDKLSKYED